MKNILIFGAGDNQLSLINEANNLGYKTIVIDPDPNAIGKENANIFKVVPAKDYNLTKKIAKEYNVDGIITCQMENPLMLMAKLAEEMNFNFPSVSSIKKARNKFLMKKAFIDANIPCAKGFLISNIEEININEIEFPVIIKPIDAFSSRGVYKVNNYSELIKYFPVASSFSSNKKVIIEEFIDGKEYSVESVTYNGNTTIIQITEKEITPFPNTVEISHLQPAKLSSHEEKEINEIIKKVILSLGLDNCATHAELKITNNGIKIIEIGARLGGDYITSHLVPLSTGISIEQLSLKIAVNDFNSIPPRKNNAAMIKYLFLPENKTVASIGEWKKILLNNEVVHANIILSEGDITEKITDSAKRPGFVIVKGENRDDVIRKTNYYIKKLESFIKLK